MPGKYNKTPTKLTLLINIKTDKTDIKPTNCHQFCLTTDNVADKTLQTTDKKLYVQGMIILAFKK